MTLLDMQLRRKYPVIVPNIKWQVMFLQETMT